MSDLIDIISHPLGALSVFLFLIILFHLIFIKIFPLKEMGEKIIDCCCFFIAAVGLFGYAAETRKLSAEIRIDDDKIYMVSAYNQLTDRIKFLQSEAFCRKFNLPEYPPANFDNIQREYDAVCAFASELNKRLPVEPPPDLSALKLSPHPTITVPDLKDYFDNINTAADHYLVSREKYEKTIKKIDRTPFEIIITMFSPIFLAIALALGITKTTSEIRRLNKGQPLE